MKKIAEKIEKKRIQQIKKCPANKSIRDYEIKHEKAKEHLEFTEFKRILILIFYLKKL